MKSLKKPLWLVKLLHFEYWDWWAFYLPLLPWYLWQAIRAKSFTYFTNVDPAIEYGGFFGESKIDILNKIPTKYCPKTLFIQRDSDFSLVKEEFSKNDFEYPVICKPNVGERGNLVQKVEDLDEMHSYHLSSGDYIIQEYVNYEIELGILYYRMPNHQNGHITSVTKKGFLKVIGNGNDTILALMELSERARFQINSFKKRWGAQLLEIPKIGKEILLEPIGNHCRGTTFYDYNHLINRQLESIFDQICHSIEGFHYGRFDIRVASLPDLQEGKNIKILELNGVSADPAHIYDPNFKLIKAYSVVAKHWKILADISIEQQKLGIRPIPINVLWPVVKAHFNKKY